MSDAKRTAPLPVLWTGGWDSTFRVLRALVLERRTVQPYYVIDRIHYRPGVPAERRAMCSIRELLAKQHPEAAGRLLPLIECAVEQIPEDATLSAHYEGCLTFGFIGGQYEWLARYCKARHIEGMELSIHRDDKARDLLAPLMDQSRVGLDSRHAGDPRYELFKCFRFPLFDLTKQAMRCEAREAGLEELMGLTWFCHKPRGKQPCGTCNPCIYTIEEGLGDRVPLLGRVRYHLRIVPRLRHWLARHPDLYLRVRAWYRRLKSERRPALTTSDSKA